MKRIKTILFIAVSILLVVFIWHKAALFFQENQVLREVIARLQADSRIAEVLVTQVHYDENTGKNFTTIKFLEYDTENRPLVPRYFTFAGNIIQFQSLVVRFTDDFIKANDPRRGKSIYLFWKVFLLDGKNTQEYALTRINEIPMGYRLYASPNVFEQKIWKDFWGYALNPAQAARQGIKNAQIEAPGMMFVPGTLYTIHIEHDGGLRIDATPLPAILRGERI